MSGVKVYRVDLRAVFHDHLYVATSSGTEDAEQLAAEQGAEDLHPGANDVEVVSIEEATEEMVRRDPHAKVFSLEDDFDGVPLPLAFDAMRRETIAVPEPDPRQTTLLPDMAPKPLVEDCPRCGEPKAVGHPCAHCSRRKE